MQKAPCTKTGMHQREFTVLEVVQAHAWMDVQLRFGLWAGLSQRRPWKVWCGPGRALEVRLLSQSCIQPGVQRWGLLCVQLTCTHCLYMLVGLAGSADSVFVQRQCRSVRVPPVMH